MSIHHEVSIHCDSCGEWQHGNESTTKRRRKAGWTIWKDEGKWLHLCPRCSAEGRPTQFGERPEVRQ